MPAKKSQNQNEERDAQMQTLEDLTTARNIALRVFNVVTPDLVEEVFSELPFSDEGELDDDDVADYEADLKTANKMAHDLFGPAYTELSAVKVVYANVFVDVEEDEDDDVDRLD